MKLLNNLPTHLTVRGLRLKLMAGDTPAAFRQFAKNNKLKYKTVFCLAKNLRDKTDLHGQPYKPSEWVYMEPTKEINPS